MTHNRTSCCSAALSIAIYFVCLGASAQDPLDKTPGGIKALPPLGLPQTAPYKLDASFKTDSFKKMGLSNPGTLRATTTLTPGSDGTVVLTLDQAQQQAAVANNPLAQLGELQVEAARQHRLGVYANYFPVLGTTYQGLHFNKHPGEVIAVQGPSGASRQVPVRILEKDSNIFLVTGAQPITPLFAVNQLVKIARADENIARAKAGVPLLETARNVEDSFFGLLVAQRELSSAKADAKKIQAKWLSASNSPDASVSFEQEKDMISAEKLLIVPASRVKELTASLNAMLGLPDGTKLELVSPDPLVEDISLNEVIEKAMTANPEVVEAEQTAKKARAAATISKLQFGPTIAVLGGFTNQSLVNVVFPRSTAFIGANASWTPYDFGKTWHGMKESKANAEAAELGVQLTKAKVAAAVRSSYLDLDRSRQLFQLASRMVSATKVVAASYNPDDPDVESARAKMEADMLRAELEYRQAYAKVKVLMGGAQ